MSEWGNPPFYTVSRTEYIGTRRRTRGSETSQYPEEKKSTEIPKVVASEIGTAQWLCCNNWKHLESCTKVGDSPVQVKINIVLE